ncbi:MAG: phosphodiester glycosidase family protein [bacterium]|nr:phosphodiester glycosidase family protein [bacterium]
MIFWKKQYFYATIFSLLLTAGFTWSLLETFVISHSISAAANLSKNSQIEAGEISKSENSYKDDNISIEITTGRTSNTTYYVADIRLANADLLKTALAKNTFGTNITETVSSMAESNSAIFAINGDYYGANSSGYVIKNGVLYRESARSSDYQDLVIYQDGSFDVVKESEQTAQDLVKSGVVQSFAFGPTLISNGKIVVSQNEEVGRAMADNPRTAIGIVEEDDSSLHYVVIVSDGRTSESEGLTIYEMAELMQEYGVKTAYNLDGGGSSTMYFNGQVINKPTTNGNIKERGVSDILYIGY